MSGVQKVLEGAAPKWFVDQFSGTLIDIFSGSVPIAFFALAIVELCVGAALALSFVPRLKHLHDFGMLGSIAIFIALSLGQRLTHQFGDASILLLLALGTYIAFRQTAPRAAAP